MYLKIIIIKFIRYILKIFKENFNEIKYPYSKRYEDLIKAYKECGLNQDRERNINTLNKCLNSLNLDIYSEENGMYSEHLIIFAAIANSKFRPKKILEIGTYDGKTALILSVLFPESTITTIDLKDDDLIFKNTYHRNKNHSDFSEKRNVILKKNSKINFLQSNSLELALMNEIQSQDLIWVDGAHGYPIVTSDITNAIRLLQNDGILMCDDIWKYLKRNDKIYNSIASFETLNAFEKAGIIKTTYFRKRINVKYSSKYKFVSFSRLTK